MFCTNCGNQIAGNSAFCTHCGAKIGSAQGMRPVQNNAVTPAPQAGNVSMGNKRSKSKAKYWLIIGGIVLLIILVWASLDSTDTTQGNVVEVNLGTLLSEIENNQARAHQLYGNKTIRLTGVATNIDNDSMWLAVSNAEYWDSLLVHFNSSERTKLANLNQGQRITIRGVFDGSGGFALMRRAVIE